VPGFDHLRIYVWFEAVIGYLSASIIHCGGTLDSGPWEAWWRPENKALHYYVHGKDNIPFHTIIFPAMLMGLGNLALPTHIISANFLQLSGGRKFSKSSGYGDTIEQFLEMVEKVAGLSVDTLRYFLTAHGPESHDAVFAWTELVNLHNSALTNSFGNLVNRVYSLTNRYCNKLVPNPGELTPDELGILTDFRTAFDTLGTHYEKGEFRIVCEEWHQLVIQANKFINAKQPWNQIKTEPNEFNRTIFMAWQMIRQLGQLIEPVLPFTAAKLRNILGLTEEQTAWGYTELPTGHQLGPQQLLFQKISRDQLPSDTTTVAEE